jgi:hypothetical protein
MSSVLINNKDLLCCELFNSYIILYIKTAGLAHIGSKDPRLDTYIPHKSHKRTTLAADKFIESQIE